MRSIPLGVREAEKGKAPLGEWDGWWAGGGVAKGVSRCCKQHANTAGVAFLFRKVVKTVSRKKHKPTGRQRENPNCP